MLKLTVGIFILISSTSFAQSLHKAENQALGPNELIILQNVAMENSSSVILLINDDKVMDFNAYACNPRNFAFF